MKHESYSSVSFRKSRMSNTFNCINTIPVVTIRNTWTFARITSLLCSMTETCMDTISHTNIRTRTRRTRISNAMEHRTIAWALFGKHYRLLMSRETSFELISESKLNRPKAYPLDFSGQQHCLSHWPTCSLNKYVETKRENKLSSHWTSRSIGWKIRRNQRRLTQHRPILSKPRNSRQSINHTVCLHTSLQLKTSRIHRGRVQDSDNRCIRSSLSGL